jgi:3',5'-cyclic AMP phosphodiesterase CpdA
MSRIVHVSDLHFGTEVPDLVAALEAQVHALAPDLVAVSGDLTQRARPRELAKAAAFISQLPHPVLTVPGNHDIPGVTPARFIDPWRGWLRHFPDGMEPTIEGADFVAVGANSVRSGGPYLDWSRGRLGEAQITRLATRLAQADGGLRILVAHHPLLLTAAGAHRGLVGRSVLALSMLRRAGLDLALGGHVHLGYAGVAGGVVVAHAGTGVSDRLVGENNGFNVIEGDHDRLTVEHWRWQSRSYVADSAADFRRGPDGWRAIAA